MPLILAIDSDRRQSEQLAALMRKSLKVELVQATSAGEGLHALRDRVPDLILTSPLLSPFDDGVLDEYLRELGTQAAHVQTVRIPVLSAVSKPSARSLFSLRKKKTPSTAPDGCDPKLFADEIAQYLARAQERRASKGASPAVTTTAEAAPSPAVIESMVHVPIATAHEDDPMVREFGDIDAENANAIGSEADDEQTPIYQPVATIHTFEIPEEPEPVAFRHVEPVASDPGPVASDPEPIVVRPMSILNLNEPRVIHQARSIANDPAPVAAREVSIIRDPDPIVDPAPPEAPSHVVSTVCDAHEPIETYAPIEAQALIDLPAPIEAPASIETDAAVEGHDSEPIVVNPAPKIVSHVEPSGVEVPDTPHRPTTAPITSFETALAAIRAAWTGPTKSTAGSMASTAAPRTAGGASGTSSSSPDVQTPVAIAPARPPQVEVDLTGDIDALEDVDHRQPADDPASTDDSSAQRRSPKPRKNGARTPVPMPRSANGSPVQDEWGIFDPNQCGFSALVDKLDEVADPHDHPARSTKVRVISIG